MIRKQSIVGVVINKNEECNYCNEPATYLIFAQGFFTIRLANVCEKHRKEWQQNILNI